MPTDSAARFLLRTYTCDAGSSPMRTTPSVGVTPRAALSFSTPALTSARTRSWTGLPWRITRAPARSRGYAQAADVLCATRVRVEGDDGAVQRGRALGRLEARRHLAEEALHDDLAIDADDALRRARHAEVGDVGGAPGQHALVGGLHVAVRADHGADAAVEVPAHCLRLAGRLAVHVDQDDRRLLAQLGQHLVGLPERAVDWRHEHAAHEIQDGHAVRTELHRDVADARRAGRKVGRAQQQVLLGDVLDDLLLVPDVVAGREHVSALIQHLLGHRRRDAEAAGGVLAVDHAEVDGVLLAQPRQELRQRRSPGLPEDVADHQHVHTVTLQPPPPASRG